MALKWRVLFACSLAFSICHAYRTSLSIVLKDVQAEFALSYSMSSLLLVAFDAGHAVTLLLSGYVGAYIGRRRAIGAAMLILTGSALASAWAAPSISVFLLYRFLAGIAMSLYITSGISLLTDAFPAGERGWAFGFQTVGSAGGRIYGVALAGAVAAAYGWRIAFSSYAGLALLGLGLFWFITQGIGERQTASQRSPIRITALLRRPSFLAGSFLLALVLTHFYAVVNFLPVFLQNVKGQTLTRTTFLFSIVNLMPFAANPAMGWLSDRLARVRVAYVVFLGNILMLLFLQTASGQGMLLLCAVLFGVFVTSNVSVVTAYFAESHTDHRDSVAVGMFTSIGVGVAVIINGLLGRIADLFGLSVIFYALALIMALALLLGLALVRRVRLDRG